MAVEENIIEEILIAPLGKTLKYIGLSISEAQQGLDANSIATQKAIDFAIEKGELTHHVEAPWYHFPDVNLELKMALSMTAKKEVDKQKKVRAYKPVILSAPLNASYKNIYDYDVKGASQIKAKIVSIPPSSRLSK